MYGKSTFGNDICQEGFERKLVYLPKYTLNNCLHKYVIPSNFKVQADCVGA